MKKLHQSKIALAVEWMQGEAMPKSRTVSVMSQAQVEVASELRIVPAMARVQVEAILKSKTDLVLDQKQWRQE